MTLDSVCASVIDRLDDALLSRREANADDLAHVHDCATCADHLSTLRVAVAFLAGVQVPELADGIARQIRLNVAQELASDYAAAAIAPRSRTLPDGYMHELVRILAWATLPLPLLLFGYAKLFPLVGALLSQVMPQTAVLTIGFATTLGAASWLAVVYGSIPFVAHRRMSVDRAQLR